MSISRLVTPFAALGVFSILACVGCGSSGNNAASAGGGSTATTAGGSSSTAGGSTSTAVNNSGGNGATGGRTVAGSGVGGTVPSLGGASSGGSANTGGTTTSTGGTKVTTGGTTNAAGATNVGGVTSAGGTKATGGVAGTNIGTTTGGAVAVGGTAATTPTPDASAGGGAGGAGGTGCTGNLQEIQTSSGLCVAKMVTIPGPGSTSFQIDATEVTRAQYQAWLATNPPTTGQTSLCTWNTSFAPSDDWPPATNPDNPVAFVNWCDAYAYCAGVGKRLCGAIGGGSMDDKNEGASEDATVDQWYAACSSGGANLYVYGNTALTNQCNTNSNGTLAVGTMIGCQSPDAHYAGIFDLVGNVQEWEDFCAGPHVAGGSAGNDICTWRGGSYDGGGNSSCSGNLDIHLRSSTGADTGFRCCSP